MPSPILAIAFGEIHEPTGIVLCQRHETIGAEFDKARGRWPVETSYTVERIEHLQRTSRYTAIVDLAVEISGKPPPVLVVDITSCGRPPLDLMRERRMRPLPVQIGEAAAVRPARHAMQLPRRELVACVSIALAERRLRVNRELPGAQALATQLEQFKTELPPASASLNAARRAESRDELVRALALALWWGEHRLPTKVKQPPVPRLPVEPPPALTFDMAVKQLRREKAARPARTRL